MPTEKGTTPVPHLGGIDVGYELSLPFHSLKPTILLVNSFTTNTSLYAAQFSNTALTSKVNLVALELLGHGRTRTKAPTWTYWDTAIMNLQAMDTLRISKAFVLGTSQGGWICTRMALLAPEKILGIIPLGTSMDYESERSRKLGCWDGREATAAPIKRWTTTETTEGFEPDDGFCDYLISIGFGEGAGVETKEYWRKEIKRTYRGDEGRKRLRIAAINLGSRDGLHDRLFDVRCPVLWIHGTADVVYSVENAKEEIQMFVNSPEARLVVVKDGQHFLSYSHPQEVEPRLVEFVEKWNTSGREVKSLL